MKQFNNVLAGIAVLTFALTAGCEKSTGPSTTDDVLQNDRMTVTNDEAAFSDRVEYFDDLDIPVDSTVLPQGAMAKRSAKFSLKQRAQVKPPKSGGITLQATHVALDGNYAYVSFNVQGETYLGGVEVFDVSNVRRPRLISQGIFNTTDVSAVSYANGKVYLAEATSDTGFVYPAAVEEIALSHNKLTLTSRRTGVMSYVATDAKVSGSKVFVTSGSGGAGVGGLSILDVSTFEVTSTDPFLDARSVALGQSSVAVMQGTPARLRLYDASSGSFVQEIFAGGANIPESKSTVVVASTRAFVAAGDEGLKVVDLGTGNIVDSLARVTVRNLDPSVTVTNAASVDGDLVFMANGEAGVYVAEAAFDLETTPSGKPKLKNLGQLNFGSLQSANFVASSNSILFVAAGTGGLKIVEIVR